MWPHYLLVHFSRNIYYVTRLLWETVEKSPSGLQVAFKSSGFILSRKSERRLNLSGNVRESQGNCNILGEMSFSYSGSGKRFHFRTSQKC